MLLKLIPLIAMVFFTTDGGAGGSEGGNDSGGDGGQTQGGDGNQQGDGATGPNAGTGTSTNSVNRQIKDFAAQRGISVEDLLSSYQQLEDAGKSESELLTGERDRYKGDAERLTVELRELRAESGFLKAAGAAGALDAETLFMAFKSRLDFDKSGSATNVADVVSALKDEKPHLFKAASGSSDGGRKGDGTGGATTMNDWIRGNAGH